MDPTQRCIPLDTTEICTLINQIHIVNPEEEPIPFDKAPFNQLELLAKTLIEFLRDGKFKLPVNAKNITHSLEMHCTSLDSQMLGEIRIFRKGCLDKHFLNENSEETKKIDKTCEIIERNLRFNLNNLPIELFDFVLNSSDLKISDQANIRLVCKDFAQKASIYFIFHSCVFNPVMLQNMSLPTYTASLIKKIPAQVCYQENNHLLLFLRKTSPLIQRMLWKTKDITSQSVFTKAVKGFGESLEFFSLSPFLFKNKIFEEPSKLKRALQVRLDLLTKNNSNLKIFELNLPSGGPFQAGWDFHFIDLLLSSENKMLLTFLNNNPSITYLYINRVLDWYTLELFTPLIANLKHINTLTINLPFLNIDFPRVSLFFTALSKSNCQHLKIIYSQPVNSIIKNEKEKKDLAALLNHLAQTLVNSQIKTIEIDVLEIYKVFLKTKSLLKNDPKIHEKLSLCSHTQTLYAIKGALNIFKFKLPNTKIFWKDITLKEIDMQRVDDRPKRFIEGQKSPKMKRAKAED